MKNTAPQLGATIAILALIGVGIVSCSSSDDTAASKGGSTSSETTTETEKVEEVEEPPEPVSLEGEWKQTNSDDPERWQKATITGDTIEVYWVADAGETAALYWAGSVTIPTDEATFSFDSVNDKSKTENALLASGDETKTFTYDGTELSYEVTVQDVTTTTKLGRQ